MYTWGAAGLVSQRELPTSTSSWYHFGPQGETRQLTGVSGAITATASYSGYGVLASGGFSNNPFGYGGQFGYYSDAAGILCGARWNYPKLDRLFSSYSKRK